MSHGQGPAGRGFRLPGVHERTLDNGVRLYALEFRNLPLVNYRIVVGVGSAEDPPGREGLADLVADLLRKGTTTRSATEIADEIDTLGAVLDTEADRDATQVTAEFLASDADAGLALLFDMLAHPAFASEEIERLRGEKLSELQAVREDPGALAGRRFMEILYGAHPYGHPTTGWESSVSAITPDDVGSFFARHGVPSNLIVVAAGDFDAPEMMARLDRTFSALPSGGAPPRRAVETPRAPAARAVHLIDKPDSTQSQIRIGGIGIARLDPDFIPILVANTILGGGFTSRLVEEIRVNRGLSYGVRSRWMTTVAGGPFFMSTFTKNETTRETIHVALAELERFREDGVTPDELERALNYLKGTFAIGHQSAASMADAAAEVAFHGLPRDYYDTFLGRLAAVTREDVARVAKRFPFDDLQIVVLGEGKAIRGALDGLGPVKEASLEGGPR